ncbi:YTH domain-containing protein ECT4-like isoform X2 [Malania oleifera]|uniref:YTH domain-containing protein ECT4-like isoform X2 n=1 Tax=Malania oleifera TaxID=397392 RepID=UPI0025AEAFFC|nr:YTH domain-containing protein ECT4-like isoform X2 [Malania oleifera]XP_057982879.1 YTH domain-containing protein ECT4-like isoform X2 [Malania oleifera]
MAAVAPSPPLPPPPSDQAADLLQKLSLDSEAKTFEVHDPTRKFATPCHQDIGDQTLCYLPNGYQSTAYYYGGYDGQVSDWDNYTRYVNSDGVEMAAGIYGDSRSLMCHHGYGYAPYSPYPPPGSSVPPIAHNGQIYGPQHYHYPTPYFQAPVPNRASYPNLPSIPQVEASSSIIANRLPLSAETIKGNLASIVNGGNANTNNVSQSFKPSYQNSSISSTGCYGRPGIPSLGYQDPKLVFDGIQSPIPWLDATFGQSRHTSGSHVNNVLSGRNQSLRPLQHLMDLQWPRQPSGMSQARFTNKMYPNNRMYGQCANTFKTSLSLGSCGYDSRSNMHGWLAIDSKHKPRVLGNVFDYRHEDVAGFNELNRGPRARCFKSQNKRGFGPITSSVNELNILNGDIESDNSPLIKDKELYNGDDFSENYLDAKFFIIKSYSEDDVHKSIKYSTWASTPNGNKKLDAAYQDAQENSNGCPVFLFFSVNTSGQFVGLAEMVGPVDFDKSLEYWQQDKWNGCFPVKWHVVKDVPNGLLKHITLENNENKPVTNSRDTQEVKFELGVLMVKIFKAYISKTCILDDFGFYEARQRTMHERKAKQQQYKQATYYLFPQLRPKMLHFPLEGNVLYTHCSSYEVLVELTGLFLFWNLCKQVRNGMLTNAVANEVKDTERVMGKQQRQLKCFDVAMGLIEDEQTTAAAGVTAAAAVADNANGELKLMGGEGIKDSE